MYVDCTLSVIIVILHRVEWLRLKQEYQKLQREAMKQTKQNLKNAGESIQASDGASNVDQKSMKQHHDKKLSDDMSEVNKIGKTKSNLPEKLEMIPGVVLKYSTKESIENKKLRVSENTVLYLQDWCKMYV